MSDYKFDIKNDLQVHNEIEGVTNFEDKLDELGEKYAMAKAFHEIAIMSEITDFEKVYYGYYGKDKIDTILKVREIIIAYDNGVFH